MHALSYYQPQAPSCSAFITDLTQPRSLRPLGAGNPSKGHVADLLKAHHRTARHGVTLGNLRIMVHLDRARSRLWSSTNTSDLLDMAPLH
jgi:hypothetical protein